MWAWDADSSAFSIQHLAFRMVDSGPVYCSSSALLNSFSFPPDLRFLSAVWWCFLSSGAITPPPGACPGLSRIACKRPPSDVPARISHGMKAEAARGPELRGATSWPTFPTIDRCGYEWLG